MDKMIYTAANGASRIMEAQAAISNNMANVSTPGFRAQLAAYRSVPVTNGPLDPQTTTRVLTVATATPSVFEQGPTLSTGRELDARIQGQGWFAVQSPDGTEGYTRAGNFNLNAQGQLVDAQGRVVLSAEGQPIDLNDASQISFSPDGGINVVPQGGTARDIQRVGQLKLVNPELANLRRSDDGLFRVYNAQNQPVAQAQNLNVKILGGALESSNVSGAEAMVNMIENARRYELHMKIIADANANAQAGNSILSTN